MLLQNYFQSIGSGVYLHIRQQLLAPTAVSLNADIAIGNADVGYLSLHHSLYRDDYSTRIVIVKRKILIAGNILDCRFGVHAVLF